MSIFGLALAFGAATPVQAASLVASTGNFNADGGGRIYEIDTVAQTVTLIGDTGLDRLAGVDFDNGGTLFGVSGGSGGPANLVTINPNTGAIVNNLGVIAGIQGVTSLAFDAAGTLYASGWDGSLGRLLTLDPVTGNILTNIATSGSGNDLVVGLDFDSGGTLFGSRGNADGHTEDLVTINTANGVQTSIGAATNVISDITFALDGTLFGGSSSIGNGDLFTIDPLTGAKTFLFNSGINISGLTSVPPVPLPAAAWMGITMLAGLGVTQIIRRRRLAA